MHVDLLTDTQLIADGWSGSLLRTEIQSGRLPGRIDGTGFSVAKSDLENWHAKQAAKQPSGRQTAHQTPAAAGTAKARYDQAINSAMAGGLDLREATKHVVETQPQLRDAMLREHNQDRERREF